MPQVSHIDPGPDTIRILITTDNHVGYNEHDPITGDDGWKTFEEIMNIAQDEDVDMVLQSGDLFHINKPTKKSMYHVMRILRRTCFGDKPVELQMLSNPSQVFNDGFNTVNYEDPNLNVSIPVFSISGNHDDASGSGLLSPLDLLSVSGLINHFGRVNQNDNIVLTPILLQKGLTKLSLFGMSSIRDERLFRTFKERKVTFKKPSINQDEWFNLMCVHQNHIVRPNTQYLPEHFLPSFLDLVIWGHEHECIPHAIPNSHTGFDVLQPGSSIATSLSIGESIEKKIFILNIKGNDYSLKGINLKTIRPFQMLDIKLSDYLELKPGIVYKNDITQFLIEKVEELIELANDKYSLENPNLDKLPLPLIRLRVDYTGGYEVENPRRFSNRFVGKVANINSVIQFHRKAEVNRSKNLKLTTRNKNDQGGDEDEENINIEKFINNYLKETELGVLPEIGFNDAIKRFIDKDDKSAIKEFIDNELSNELEMFMKNDNVDLEDDKELNEFLTKIKKENSKKTTQGKNSTSKESTPIEDDEQVIEKPVKKPTRAKAKPKAAQKISPPTKRRTRPVKSVEVVDSDSDVDVDDYDDDNEFDGDDDNEEQVVEKIISDDDLIEVDKTPSPKPIKPSTRGRATRGSRGSSRASTKGSRTTKTSSKPAKTPMTDNIANLLARKRK